MINLASFILNLNYHIFFGKLITIAIDKIIKNLIRVSLKNLYFAIFVAILNKYDIQSTSR